MYFVIPAIIAMCVLCYFKGYKNAALDMSERVKAVGVIRKTEDNICMAQLDIDADNIESGDMIMFQVM